MAKGLPLLVGGLVGMVTGCPFRYLEGEPLPEGHPPARRLADYPGYIVDEGADEGNLANIWPPAASEPQTDRFKAITKLSSDRGDAELCYWSFQTLPGPQMKQAAPTVTSDDVDVWFDNTRGEAPNFGDMAVTRMKNLSLSMANGPFVWAGCSIGRTLHKAMCDKGRAMSTVVGARLQDCNTSAVREQELMVPTAIAIFKFKASTNYTLWRALLDWRSSDEHGHAPQMMGDLVQKRGWGPGGQIISKVVMCSDIPAYYKYQNYGSCGAMGNSRLAADEAFAIWKSLRSLSKPAGAGTSATIRSGPMSTFTYCCVCVATMMSIVRHVGASF